MSGLIALDNLHRKALCYQPKTKKRQDFWVRECRKVRDIVEKDLEALYIIKKYKTLRELNVDYISNKREKKLLKEVLRDE